MPEYSLRELTWWNNRIEEIVREKGLICNNQEFELIAYEDMIACEAYAGMPSHYPHWSYGKAYERIRTLNRYNILGLPYEIVINSNPCIAYLLKENSLLLQIMTIAHVCGHNDFFKNNRLFASATGAEYTVEMFKNHAVRIREYISDPSIGYGRVERTLNAAHALRYQCARTIGERRLKYDELKKRLQQQCSKMENPFPLLEPVKPSYVIEPDLKQIPLAPEDDLLYFIGTYARLSEWEKDIIDIVREETFYFIPQIETKIINEGWATYWHYILLNQLELPQQLYFEFLKRHNQIVKPYMGAINPYYLGFKLFENLCKRNPQNPNKIFEAREFERDSSFIRRFLTKELCSELKLYEYEKDENEYIVSEIADEEGWEKIRNTIAESSGMGNIPIIRVINWNQKENKLLLEHIYDGRELDMHYANETLKHIVDLWEGDVILNTFAEGRKRSIYCDGQKKILMVNT